MAKIESIRSALVDCPLKSPAVFSTRRVASRQYLLVRVRCSDGVEGIGATYCGDRGGELCHLAVQELLAPVVAGRDPNNNPSSFSAYARERRVTATSPHQCHLPPLCKHEDLPSRHLLLFVESLLCLIM